jgi:hypothetical protein
MKRIIIPILALIALTISCKENEVEPKKETPAKAKVTLKLEHVFNGEALDFNKVYRTENGDTIKISELKYFISNFGLINEINSQYAKNSYYLINPSTGKTEITVDLGEFEEQDFSKFRLSVGVDSARNHSITNAVGDLDPAGADQMIWSWATGYKFIKFEGSFAMADSSGNFIYHAGGDANYKVFNFESSAHENTRITSEVPLVSLKSGKTTEIHLVVDLAEVFKSPNLLNVRTKLGHTGGATILDNLATSTNTDMNGWFELHHIITE